MDREEDVSIGEMLGLATPTPSVLSDENLLAALLLYKSIVGYTNLSNLDTVLDDMREKQVQLIDQSFAPDDGIAELENELFVPRTDREEAEDAAQEAWDKGDITPGTKNHAEWIAATDKLREIKKYVDPLERRLQFYRRLKEEFNSAVEAEQVNIDNGKSSHFSPFHYPFHHHYPPFTSSTSIPIHQN